MDRIFVWIFFLMSAACSTIKPYEKEYLLHPLMDDESVAHLDTGFAKAASAEQEHLSSAAQGTSGSSSCPTCGG